MIQKPELFSGQGALKIAKKINGAWGPFLFAGNVTALGLTPSITKVQHKESVSGARAVDKEMTSATDIQFSATFENFEPDVLAIALRGETSMEEGGTVTGEVMGMPQKGRFLALENMDISALEIVDSSTPALELKEETHYALNDSHGSIEMLTDKVGASTITGPLIASYQYGAYTEVSIMSGGDEEYLMRFEGLNTAEKNDPVLILFKVAMNAADALNLISDDFNNYNMSGAVLFDDDRGDMGYIKRLGKRSLEAA